MNTFGIVILSLIAGLFLAILIGAIIFLIWVCLRLHKSVLSAQSDFSSKVESHDQAIIKFETNTQQLLQTHANVLGQLVSKINGESLEAASKSIHLSAGRIEKACIAFGELAKFILADRDTINPSGTGLAPDEFATPEPGEKFVDYNPTAAGDRSASIEEES